MKYNIKLNSFDLIKTITYAHMRNKPIWIMCVASALFITGIGFIGVWAMSFPIRETISQFMSFFSWMLGLFIVGLLMTILSLVLNPKWRKGRIGEHGIEITDSSIVESTEYNRSEISWSSISKVSVKSSGIYFIHSGFDAFFIPRSSFTESNNWDQFKELFLEKWRAKIN